MFVLSKPLKYFTSILLSSLVKSRVDRHEYVCYLHEVLKYCICLESLPCMLCALYLYCCTSKWCVCILAVSVSANSMCRFLGIFMSHALCYHFIPCVKMPFIEFRGSLVCAQACVCNCMHVSNIVYLFGAHTEPACVFRMTCRWPGSSAVWPQSLSASVCLCHSSWTEKRCCSSYWCPSSCKQRGFFLLNSSLRFEVR